MKHLKWTGQTKYACKTQSSFNNCSEFHGENIFVKQNESSMAFSGTIERFPIWEEGKITGEKTAEEIGQISLARSIKMFIYQFNNHPPIGKLNKVAKNVWGNCLSSCPHQLGGPCTYIAGLLIY